MELFQILDCGSSIGACCTDYSLVNILNIARRVFDVIQILVPIILIIAATIQFVQLTINPEQKDGFRKILNKLIAAIIVFVLPFIMNVIMGAVGESTEFSSCWNNAPSTINIWDDHTYYPTEDEKDTSSDEPIKDKDTTRYTKIPE